MSWAPIARACSRRSGTTSAISTVAPRSPAARQTAWPIGPAPRTTTRSPASTRARTTARTPIEVGSTKAVTAGAMSPTAKTCEAGTRRRSCSAPSTWAPMIAMFAHTFWRPMLHG